MPADVCRELSRIATTFSPDDKDHHLSHETVAILQYKISTVVKNTYQLIDRANPYEARTKKERMTAALILKLITESIEV
jgi:hypothetical protein